MKRKFLIVMAVFAAVAVAATVSMSAAAIKTNIEGNVASNVSKASNAARAGSSNEAWDGTVDISWYTNSASDPTAVKDFEISKPAELAGLAYIVNGKLDSKIFPVKYKDASIVNGKYTGDYDKRLVKDASQGGKTVDIYRVNDDHKGKYDIDYEDMIRTARTNGRLIDGTGTDGTGTTASGLSAEDFWTEGITHIKSSGGGSGVTDSYRYIGNQKYDFIGQTVHITADINLGASYDENTETFSGPNWAPIGGGFPLDSYADYYTKSDSGKLVGHRSQNMAINASFNGVLDGGYHNITNYYCDRWASDGEFLKGHGQGFVGALGELYDRSYDDNNTGYGHMNDPEECPEGWVPAVKNLALGNMDSEFTGMIKGNRRVGGIVGSTGDIDNGILVENCANYVHLESTDAKGLGGIIGATSGTGTVRNCYNAGWIHTDYSTSPAGGIVGSNTINIYNCYNRGYIQNDGNKEFSEGIGSNYDGGSYSYVVDNCYVLGNSYQDMGNGGYYKGTATSTVINVKIKTKDYMQSENFRYDINDNAGDVFVDDIAQINDGYPVLFWQANPPAGKSKIMIDQNIQRGSIKLSIPRIKEDGVYKDARDITAEDTADGPVEVPAGTVISISPLAQSPNVLDYYTVKTGDGEAAAIGGSCYTATDVVNTVTIGAEFIRLTRGSVLFDKATSEYEMGISKIGTVVDENGNTWKGRDIMLNSGDTIFQNDVLTSKAVQKKGANPRDKTKEYSGVFSYTFTYDDNKSKSNHTGIHSVERKIGNVSAEEEDEPGSLNVTASSIARDKTWASLTDTSWCQGTKIIGTYEIKNEKQLAGFAKLVNDGYSFKGATVKLAKDISLSNTDGTSAVRLWNPIGTSSCKFSGTFDGNGKTVYGMNVSLRGSAGALFGYTKGATIKNLSVNGISKASGQTAGIVSVMSGGSISNCTNNVTVIGQGIEAGGIAAAISDKAAVTGCVNKAAVTGFSRVGGLVGTTTITAGKISRCANYGTVKGIGGDTGSSTGGLVGDLYSSVNKSANFGAVSTANTYAGGVAGKTLANQKGGDSSSSSLTDCFNRANVASSSTRTGTSVGGMVGYAKYIISKNCYSTGSVSMKYSGKTYLGSLVGQIGKKIYNDVDCTYYTGGTAVGQNPKLDNVKVTRKTVSEMKKAGFVKLLNSKSKGTFAAVGNNYPQLTWITKKKEYAVKYTGAYSGSVKTYYGGTVILPKAPAGYYYKFKVAKSSVEFTGENIKSNVKVKVYKRRIKTAYVIFRVDGRTVAKIKFKSGDKYIKNAAPDVGKFASKEGYTVSWSKDDMSDYWNSGRNTALGSSNICVDAVYAQNILEFERRDDIDKPELNRTGYFAEIDAHKINNDGGYYFLAPQSKGTVIVKSDTADADGVIIDGKNGPFNNIRIVVEEGAKLTIKDLKLTADPARIAGIGHDVGVLHVVGTNDENNPTTVKFSGKSRIVGCNDGNGDNTGAGHFYSTLKVSGFVRLTSYRSDSDMIFFTALHNNPALKIDDKAQLEIAGGIVEAYKLEKLGRNGGLIYGEHFDYTTCQGTDDQGRGNLKVSGGSLISVSDTNNVFPICVNEYIQTGGQASFYSAEAQSVVAKANKDIGTDYALYADKINYSGGILYVKSRTHKNAITDPIEIYEHSAALRDLEGFTDNYYVYEIDTSDWNGSIKTVSVDEKQYYRGTGCNVSYKLTKDSATGDLFTTQYAYTDKKIYIWLSNDGAHTVKVDNKVIGSGITQSNVK